MKERERAWRRGVEVPEGGAEEEGEGLKERGRVAEWPG